MNRINPKARERQGTDNSCGKENGKFKDIHVNAPVIPTLEVL